MTHHMAHSSKIPRHSGQVAARIFDGEAVVITPAENMVRMFNRVGSRVWELVDGVRSIGEIAALLSWEYEVTEQEAEHEVIAFLNNLAGKGLIELGS